MIDTRTPKSKSDVVKVSTLSATNLKKMPQSTSV
jgi:hypothetical protein